MTSVESSSQQSNGLAMPSFAPLKGDSRLCEKLAIVELLRFEANESIEARTLFRQLLRKISGRIWQSVRSEISYSGLKALRTARNVSK